ncbi:two component regulator propeller [Paludibacter jiangxiensis]|uniref:histidine kinase n=2 Tax=Paludibacter jiangxiensis TaxID=681398 RepID=A0A171AF17_9BACT|nr:two component regulator propeller [Paludibacter jiangxiensis]
MWFSSRYGVNRFDGSKIKTFIRNTNVPTLNSNDINHVTADVFNNKIWISNTWAGINVFDCETETFSSFYHTENDKNSLASNYITNILVTKKGNVWIGTADKGLDLFDPVSKQFKHYNRYRIPNFPSDKISSLAEGKNGDLYIGHPEDGLTIFSPQKKQIRNFKHVNSDKYSIAGNRINFIVYDTDSIVWLATDNGLSIFNPLTGKFRNFKDAGGIHSTIKKDVLCISKTSDNRIWIGTTSDLCYFNRRDIEEILRGKKDVNFMYIQDIFWGISNPSVMRVYEDSFKNIWIGSNGGGCSFISNISPFFNNWKTNRIPGVVNGMNDIEATCICAPENGKVWIGTDGGGINVYENGKNVKIYSRDKGNASSQSYCASIRTSNGDLWFGTPSDGIDIFNQKGIRTSNYQLKLGHCIIYCLYEDNRRNIWIGTNKGLEICNLDTKEITLLTAENGNLPTNEIRSISQDHYNRIWIGTLNKGIILFDKLSKNTKYTKSQIGFNNNVINQIFRDSKNRMWIATGEGLICFPTNRLDKYIILDNKHGLACNSICAIAEDTLGYIWVSTNLGISCYLEAENRFLNYDHFDGALYGNYINNSVAKAPDGTIYFGSTNGVCFFNPLKKQLHVILPPIVFTEFKVYQKDSYKDAPDVSLPMINGNVSLKCNQNIFSVSFNIMNKALQGQIEYSYLLEGLESSWINIGYENHVTFRNIPYNKYKLHVRARYKSQKWQESPSILTITIAPPIWLTWWAKLIYIILLTVGTWYVISYYKKSLQLKNTFLLEKERALKQQKIHEERLRFYANIAHELRTPLTLILGPLEDLQNSLGFSKEQQRKLSLIQKSALRLLNLVTQILEFRKTETQNKQLRIIRANIAEAIMDAGVKFKELNMNPNINFETTIDTDRTLLYFDHEVITTILDNLLSNAFKYTKRGNIHLRLRSVIVNQTEFTEIEVSDTGIGIPEVDLPHIFERYYQASNRANITGIGIGLSLVKNLVDLHKGSIYVDSNPEVGTTFRIRLLTDNSYPNAIHINNDCAVLSEEKSKKPIVLVVEDDIDLRNYIAESLESVYSIVLAENGEKGLEAAHASIPDIIISDIMMPVMDGMEFCKKIKNNIETSHIPVILLTAKDTIQDKALGYEIGADSYITKPFSTILLKSRIENLMSARNKLALLISSNLSLKHHLITESTNKLDNEFIEKITSVIEENLMDEKIDMSSISYQLSMSYSSLYRKIKALTGMSVSEFIRKIRVRKAEQFLLSGKYNVSEITHLVGLNSISYFRECFKEEYGMSPSVYIKKIKENKTSMDLES